MWSVGGAAIAIGLAVLAALAFTPEPGFTPAMGFAGWPRLGLYALGGVILASSAPAVSTAPRGYFRVSVVLALLDLTESAR